MLSPEPMQKLRIIVLDSDRYEVVRTLHALGVIDIRRSALQLSEAEAAKELPEISNQLVRFRSALATLDEVRQQLSDKKQRKMDKQLSKELRTKHMHLKQLMESCERMHTVDTIFALTKERTTLNDDLASLKDALSTAEMFIGLDIDFSKLRSEVIEFSAFTIDNKDRRQLRALKQDVSTTNTQAELIGRQLDSGKALVFIAAKKGDMQQIENALRNYNRHAIDITNRYLNGRGQQLVTQLKKQIEQHQARLAHIKSELELALRNDYVKLATLNEMLEIEADRAGVSTNFKKTAKTVVIEGWVPKRHLENVKNAVSRITKESETEIVHDKELAPTMLNRPGALKSFDYLMKFYSMPRSDEIDPTWIFILTFIIFYGFMVTDVGYGIISLLLATFLTKKSDPDGLLYNASRVWQIAAIPAIIFGVLSNQYFGLPLNNYFLNGFKLFDWTHDITTLIVITIFFGIAQVILGLVFAFVNNYKRHHINAAISKITAIIAIAAGVIAVGGGLFHVFPTNPTLYAAGISIAALVATALLATKEATELLSLITHPLSYTRILGFGLASVIIASLINQAFTPSLSNGPVLFVVYAVIFIALHMLNMVLTIFEGMVQAVRLNFVEFFSKFYIGRGVEYKPYHYKRRYTKE